MQTRFYSHNNKTKHHLHRRSSERLKTTYKVINILVIEMRANQPFQAKIEVKSQWLYCLKNIVKIYNKSFKIHLPTQTHGL